MAENALLIEAGFSEETLRELDEIESVVLDNFKSCSSVESSFGEIAKDFFRTSNEIAESMSDSDSDEETERKAVEAGVNAAIGTGLQGAANLINAFNTTRISSKILEQKQKIARTKLPSIGKTIEKAERLCNINQKVFLKRGEIDYKIFFPECGYLTGGVGKRIEGFENNIKLAKVALGMFRKSLLNLNYLYFLENQYNAWINGRHDSDSMVRPTLEMINDSIVNQVLFPLSQKDIQKNNSISRELSHIMNKIIENKQENVDGRFMYILTDKQLLSSLMSNFNNSLLLVENKEKISSVVMNYLNDNETFHKLEELHEIYDDNEGSMGIRACLYYLNAILFTVIVIIGFMYFIEWDAWIEWLAGIIISIAGFYKAAKVVEKANEKYELKKKYIKLYITNCLRKIAGHEPRIITMTEQIEKSNATFIGGVIGALIGFFFIPIPGGLLLGLVIGAGIGGTSTEAQQKESDGSEYENVHYGNMWKGCILNLILLCLIIYLIYKI